MSFFIRLIEATDTSRRELEALPKVQAMLNGKMTKKEYQDFLADLYHIVRHFCPIMAAAASRCSDSHAQLRNHLYRHIDAEKGHEDWVAQDMAALGSSHQEIKHAAPSHAVQAMIASNYYLCERVHPFGVLGMLYVLEILSSVYGGQVATSISQGLDMPLPRGFTFLESHSSMDLDHMADIRTLLDTVDNSYEQEVIINAIQLNFYLFIQFLKN